MKTFKQVKSEMNPEFRDCLMTMRTFLKYWENDSISSLDGVGDLHNGEEFVTDGFEVNIFEYIINLAYTMSKSEIIRKFPYVAWYNK